jgi:hypothetical protein
MNSAACLIVRGAEALEKFLLDGLGLSGEAANGRRPLMPPFAPGRSPAPPLPGTRAPRPASAPGTRAPRPAPGTRAPRPASAPGIRARHPRPAPAPRARTVTVQRASGVSLSRLTWHAGYFRWPVRRGGGCWTKSASGRRFSSRTPGRQPAGPAGVSWLSWYAHPRPAGLASRDTAGACWPATPAPQLFTMSKEMREPVA